MKIFTTETIDNIIQKENKGEIISRYNKIWYNNIKAVRKPKIKFAMNINELEEYSNCRNSIKYFSENHCNILDEKSQMKIIELRDYQKEILKTFEDKRFIINFTSRQVGMSILYAIYFLHLTNFYKNKNIYIMSHKLMNSKELISKIKNIYKLLPFYLKTGVYFWNEGSIVFENGSSIRTISNSKNLAIGNTIDTLLIEDFSKMPNQEEIYSSLIPTISSIENSRFIIHSGPNGANFFYELLKNSEKGENVFETIRTYWWQVPGRDENWKKEQIKMLGSEILFAQEYDLAFIVEKKNYDIIY